MTTLPPSLFDDHEELTITNIGMAEDLDLTGNRFNIGLSAFFVTYILFEV